jgi:hypothetical protein
VSADLYLEDAPGKVTKLRATGQAVTCVANSTNRAVGPSRAETWINVERMVVEIHESWKRANPDPR